jgi:hypothetical protein
MWMWIGQGDEAGGQAENREQDQSQGEEEVTPPPATKIMSRAEARGRRDAMPLAPSGIRFLFPAPLRFCAH